MSNQTQQEPLHNPWVFSGLMAASQSQAPRNMAVFMACSTWASPDLTDAILLSTWHNKGHSHHLAWKGLDWHTYTLYLSCHPPKKRSHLQCHCYTRIKHPFQSQARTAELISKAPLEYMKSIPHICHTNGWWFFRFQQPPNSWNKVMLEVGRIPVLNYHLFGVTWHVTWQQARPRADRYTVSGVITNPYK